MELSYLKTECTSLIESLEKNGRHGSSKCTRYFSVTNYEDTHAVLCSTLRSLCSFQFVFDDFIIRNWSILHSRCRKSLLLHYCFFNATCFIGQPPVKVPCCSTILWLFGDGWSQARWKAHIEFLRLWGAKSALMPGRSPHSYDVELRTLLKLVQQVMLQSLQEHRLLRHLSVRCFVIPFIFWIIWKRLLLRNNCISICVPSIESSDALVIQMVEEYWLLPPLF